MVANLKHLLMMQTMDMNAPYMTVFPSVFRPLKYSTGDGCLGFSSVPVSDGYTTGVAEILGVDVINVTLYLYEKDLFQLLREICCLVDLALSISLPQPFTTHSTNLQQFTAMKFHPKFNVF